MNAQEALERLDALRELTTRTGVKTTRTQNTILANLSSETLMEVALELKRRGPLFGNRTELRGTEHGARS